MATDHYWIRDVVKDMYNYCRANNLEEIAAYCLLIEVCVENFATPQFRPPSEIPSITERIEENLKLGNNVVRLEKFSRGAPPKSRR